MLAEFESAVDSIHRRKRGRENRSDEERRPAALLEKIRQDIRGIREKVCPEKILHFRLREVGQIRLELPLSISPTKVGVALGKPGLGKHGHHLWTRKRFAKKLRIRILLVNLRDHPFPERNGLSVRIVHPENTHPELAPKGNYIVQLPPQSLPVRVVK